VLAGGKPAKAVLVSRTILQITIAKDCCPTPGGNGQPLLDINVATPNGVSNHLLVRMLPPCPDKKPAEKKKPSKPEPPKKEHDAKAEPKKTAEAPPKKTATNEAKTKKS
jgi:hypothetical protein